MLLLLYAIDQRNEEININSNSKLSNNRVLAITIILSTFA